MRKSQHWSNNGVLGAPPGVDIETCEALPITKVRWKEGGEGILSYWKPSPDELALLSRGALVRLCIQGPHPMVNLGVDGDGQIL